MRVASCGWPARGAMPPPRIDAVPGRGQGLVRPGGAARDWEQRAGWEEGAGWGQGPGWGLGQGWGGRQVWGRGQGWRLGQGWGSAQVWGFRRSGAPGGRIMPLVPGGGPAACAGLGPGLWSRHGLDLERGAHWR